MVAVLFTLLAVGPYEQYQVDNETTCIGKADFAFADSWSADGFQFELGGGSARVHAADPREARLGLLSAIKDFSPETQANLRQFVGAFQKARVAGVIVDGDSAYGVED